MISAQVKAQEVQQKGQVDAMKAQADMIKAQADIGHAQQELHEKKKDRMSRERIQLIDLAQNLAVHPYSADLVAPLFEPALTDLEQEKAEDKMQQGGVLPPGMGGR